MAYIVIDQVQAWAETTKLTLGDIDDELADTTATQILARVAQAYDVSGWTTGANTPKLIVKIIAMQYFVWFYRRQYSEDGGTNEYVDKIQAMIDMLITGILAFVIVLVDVVPPVVDPSSPAFYPTDQSSSMTPNNPTDPSAVDNDLSLGPAAFTMGRMF